MKSLLLIIDAQNDFCKSSGSLYVAGAEDDMCRLATFIKARRKEIGHIVLSQDAHQIVDISHPAFWLNNEGKHPVPFTSISFDDVKQGKWRPVFGGNRAERYLQLLEEQGEYPHVIWPEHCIAGSEGAAIEPEIMTEVKHWAREGNFFTVIQKGQNPFTEHFGLLKANVPDYNDERTLENKELLLLMEQYSTIYIAG
jgi:nicotinamidase-related amidase